jgi:hypothetical protein
MRPRFVFVTLVSTLLVGGSASTALADNTAACVAAASKAQKLRAAHQLVEARTELRFCSAATCPQAVQNDCVPWLADVEKAVPGVVVAAKNAAGKDVIDVQVTMDGKPLLSKLDGQAMPMDAGPHTFHFETADGASVDQQALIREGDKNQTVSVVLGAPPAAGAILPATSLAPPPPAPSGAVDVAPTLHAGAPWRTIGWVAGGVGVAGLAVGATMGAVTLSAKGSHCNGDTCAPGTIGGIQTDAVVSDIGWISGGVLLATGAALVLFGPHPSNDSTTGVRIVPVVTASGGQLVALGRW